MTTTAQFLDQAFGRRVHMPIAEVAEITCFPVGPLLADCRAGRIDCQWRHGKYYMKREHVEKLLNGATRKARPAARPKTLATAPDTPVDVEEWAARKRQQLARKAG